MEQAAEQVLTAPPAELDLDALAAVAEAATPGPWEVLDSIHRDPYVLERGKGVLTGGSICLASHRDDYGRANAAHIAAFDPPTVLALIAEAREAQRLRGTVAALADEWEQVYDRWTGVSDGPRVAIFKVHARRLRALIGGGR